MDKVETIIAARKSKYGEFRDNAELTQRAYDVFQMFPGWANMDYGKRHGVYMILHKIARAVCGDANYDDNWVDIEGYTKRIIEDLKKPETVAGSDVAGFAGGGHIPSTEDHYHGLLRKAKVSQ